jgi:hypothetical protein
LRVLVLAPRHDLDHVTFDSRVAVDQASLGQAPHLVIEGLGGDFLVDWIEQAFEQTTVIPDASVVVALSEQPEERAFESRSFIRIGAHIGQRQRLSDVMVD